MNDIKLTRHLPKGRVVSFPTITVYRSGVRFNKACLPYFRRQDFCEVFYDRVNQIVAFRPTQTESMKTYKIKKYRREVSPSIACRKICEIILCWVLSPDEKSFRTTVKWDNKNHCFVLNLKNIEEKRKMRVEG